MSESSYITQSELTAYVEGAVDILRGVADDEDYKQYFCPLLFYKRMSDVWDENYAAALVETGDEEYAHAEANKRFTIPAGAHWNEVRVIPKDIGQAIQGALRAIESKNLWRLEGSFGDAPWTNKERLPDATLKDLLEHFSTQTLSIANVPEYMLANTSGRGVFTVRASGGTGHVEHIRNMIERFNEDETGKIHAPYSRVYIGNEQLSGPQVSFYVMGQAGESQTEGQSQAVLLGWVSILRRGKTVVGVQVDPNASGYFQELSKWLQAVEVGNPDTIIANDLGSTPPVNTNVYPAVIFFKQPCRCQPEIIKGVLVDFLARYGQVKNLEDTCLRGLEIKKKWLDELTVHYTLNLIRYGDFGGVGFVNVMRLNDTESEIEAGCFSGDGPTIMDERAEVYEASLELMKTLANRLQELYRADRGEEGEPPLPKPHRQPGRPHYREDVWAWEQVNKLYLEPRHVYDEWIAKPEVLQRNIIDPERHYKRIIQSKWMAKSGRNI